MRIHYLFLVLTGLLFAGSVVAQPTFASGQDPKPAGKRWVKNDAFSDEFNADVLDGSKWYDFHPTWQGRPPARFKPEAVTLCDGKLEITNYKLPAPEVVNGQTFTIGGGAVSSRSEAAHYGYYECRMKASEISMSSTFWLINQNPSYCPGGKTELDIQECIGGAKEAPSFRNSIHSNTHYYPFECGEDLPTKSAGGDAPIGGNVAEAFHVYGAFWEDANNIHIYVDGAFKFTMHPSTEYDATPFDRPMFMNMVTETYDWQTPPTDEELATLNTTTQYDWVRSWTLADDETVTEDLTTTRLPTDLVPAEQYTVEVDYKVAVDKFIAVEFYDDAGWLATGTAAVSAGTGCAMVTVSPGVQPAGTAYSWRAGLRTVADDWTTNSVSKNVEGVLIAATGVETVSLDGGPKYVAAAPSYPVTLSYVAGTSRDLVVALFRGNTYLGNGTTTVAAGSGTATVTVNLPAAPQPGTDYNWRASLRAVGGDFSTNVADNSVFDVTVNAGIAEGVVFSQPSLLQTVTSQATYSVTVDYQAASSRDIVLEFWNATNWIGGKLVTVPAGSGSTVITLNMPGGNPPPPGVRHQWKVNIRPTNTTFRENLAGSQINGVRVAGDLAETVAFIAPPAEISPQATGQRVIVRYQANAERELFVALFRGDEYVTNASLQVPPGSGNVCLDLSFAGPLAPGENYILKSNIRPLGGDPASVTATTQVENITVATPAPEGVDFVNPPLNVTTPSSVTLAIDYVAYADRQLFVSFWDATNFTYLTGSSTTVPAGSGTYRPVIDIPMGLDTSLEYFWQVVIRPPNTGFEANIEVEKVEGVIVFEPLPEGVAFTDAPLTVASPRTVELAIDYVAYATRQIFVSFWNQTTFTFLTGVNTTVEAGNGTYLATVNVPAGLDPGQSYFWQAVIRPPNTGFQNNIDVKKVENVSIGQPLADDVSTENLPTILEPQASYTVAVPYEATTDRDIVVEFWKGNVWQGATRKTVSSGAGTETFVVTPVAGIPTEGNDYLWKVSIRPVGTDYLENLVLREVVDVVVRQPVVETVSLADLPTAFTPSLTYQIPVDYVAAETRDVVVELRAPGQVFVGVWRASVATGASTVTVPVSLTEPPAPGSGYTWKAAIRPVGTDFTGNIFLTEVEDVVMLDNVAPVAICQPVTVYLDASGAGGVTVAEVDGGSYDEHGTLHSSSLSAVTFDCGQVGTPTSTLLTLTDDSGNSSSCTATITVVDAIGPEVAAVADLTIYLDADGIADLAATAVDAGSADACGIASVSVAPDVFYCADVGDNSVTLTVIDVNGNQRQATTVVRVADELAPTLTLHPDTVLWPPNHAFVGFALEDMVAAALDNCPVANVWIVSVSVDEPEYKKWDPEVDGVTNVVIGQHCDTVWVQRERLGNGNGRVYTILLGAEDAAGNLAYADYRVSIPHSDNGAVAIRDADVYTVAGSCGGAAAPALGAPNPLGEAAPMLVPGPELRITVYPNPFHTATTITIGTDRETLVSASVLDLNGRTVAQLLTATKLRNSSRLHWDGTGANGQRLPAGIYPVRIVTPDGVRVKNVVLR